MDSDGTKMGLKRLKNKLEDLFNNVRSTRDFDRFNNMITQLDKIGI
jgi:hypothetical protein